MGGLAATSLANTHSATPARPSAPLHPRFVLRDLLGSQKVGGRDDGPHDHLIKWQAGGGLLRTAGEVAAVLEKLWAASERHCPHIRGLRWHIDFRLFGRFHRETQCLGSLVKRSFITRAVPDALAMAFGLSFVLSPGLPCCRSFRLSSESRGVAQDLGQSNPSSLCTPPHPSSHSIDID